MKRRCRVVWLGLVVMAGGLVADASGQGYLFAVRSGPPSGLGLSGGAIYKFDTGGNIVDQHTSDNFARFTTLTFGLDGRLYSSGLGVAPDSNGSAARALLSYDPDDLSDERVVIDNIPSFLAGGGWNPGAGVRNMGTDKDGNLVLIESPAGAARGWRIKIEANGSATSLAPNPFMDDGPTGGFFGIPANIGPADGYLVEEKNGYLFVKANSNSQILVFDQNGNWVTGAETGLDPAILYGNPVGGGKFGPDLNNDGEEDFYTMINYTSSEQGRVRVISGKEIFDGTFPNAQPPVLSTDFTNNLTDSRTGSDDWLVGSARDIEFLEDGRMAVGHNPQHYVPSGTADGFCGIRLFDPATGLTSLFHEFQCYRSPALDEGSPTTQQRGPDGVNAMLWLAATATYNPADFNQDGQVDPGDFAILAGNWLMAGNSSAGDANGDGFVDPSDFAILAGNWLLGVGGVAGGLGVVPEPGTLLLGLLGLVGLVGYAWRRRATDTG